MANPFDQFDEPAPTAAANPFDQFDAPAAPAPNPFDQFDTPSAPVDPAPVSPALDNPSSEPPVPSGAASLPARPVPELRAYEEPSLPRRAVTAVREVLSPIIGPTPNQRLRAEQDRMAFERDFPGLAALAAQSGNSRTGLIQREGFIGGGYQGDPSIPWYIEPIATSPDQGAVAQVGAGILNTGLNVWNSSTTSAFGPLSLAAAPVLATSRLAAGAFAGDMARQTVENIPQTLATLRDDDASLQEKTEAVGGTVVSAGLAALGARGALRSETPAVAAAPDAGTLADAPAPDSPVAAEPSRPADAQIGGPLSTVAAAAPEAAPPARPAPIAEIIVRETPEPVTAAEMPGAVRAAMEAERPPSVSAPVEPAAVAAGGEVKPLGLLESARRADAVAPETKAGLEGDYTVAGNAATLAEAARRIDAATTLDDARRTVMAADNPDAVTQAMGLDLVRRYQEAGQFDAAAEVLNHMAVKAKSQGQAIQILSTLSRSTPEGVASYAQRLFGRKLTPEEFAGIKKEIDWVQAATDPQVRLGRQAIMLGKLQEKLPIDIGSKINAARNLALLLNPKTQIRNVIGNVFMAAGDMAADVVSVPVDAGVKVFTGQRTISGPEIVEYAKGFTTPAKEFRAAYRQARAEGSSRVRSLASAADVMHALTKLGDTSKMELADVRTAYRLTFSSPLMRGLEKTLGLAMGVPDRAFYMGRLSASLKSQMRAAEAVVPTADMLDRASLEAARATYQDRNFVSVALNEVRQAANKASTLGASRQFGLGSAVLPFTQVPGALLLRSLEFSPVGFVKAAAEALVPVFTKRGFNQREFSQAFSRALVGTGGLAALGYWLNSLGVVTGAPNQDKRVAQLEREMGLGAYKVNVSELKRRIQSMDWATPSQGPQPGDTLLNYDWVQPLALPVAFGADLRASKADEGASGTQRVMQGLFTGVRTLEEQPLLMGLTGFFKGAAYARDGQGGLLEAAYNTMLELPASFVPTAIRQMRDLMDNRVYELRGSDKMEQAYQNVLASLPEAAERLGYKPRVDILGTPLERYQGGENTFFNVIINPAMVTRMKKDPQLRELYAIWQGSGETAQVPEARGKTITVNGEQRSLTAAERADYQQFVGRLTREGFRVLMSSPAYASAPYEKRAQVLAQWISSADLAARIKLFGHRPTSGDSADVAAILLGRRITAADKAARN